MSKLQEKFGDKGFTVLAVNGYDESKALVKSYIEREKLKQPVLLMGRAVARQKYQVTGFPTNVWVDHEGKVVHKEVGFSPEMFPAMEVRLERLLARAKRDALDGVSR